MSNPPYTNQITEFEERLDFMIALTEYVYTQPRDHSLFEQYLEELRNHSHDLKTYFSVLQNHLALEQNGSKKISMSS